MSIARVAGIAANISFRTGAPCKADSLVEFPAAQITAKTSKAKEIETASAKLEMMVEQTAEVEAE